MQSFRQFIEGYPGTAANPPGDVPWGSPETRVWQHPDAAPTPIKPERIHKGKELNRLPPHLRDHPDVIASSEHSLASRVFNRLKKAYGMKTIKDGNFTDEALQSTVPYNFLDQAIEQGILVKQPDGNYKFVPPDNWNL